MNTKSKMFILAFLAISLSACVNSKKKSETKLKSGFTVIDSTATVKWTAYKTTDKKPVSGVFKTINIKKSEGGATRELALNNLEFSIPVSSLFSNNEERDGKLKNMFFGIMANTTLLSGTIHVNAEHGGSLDIKMNGITKNLTLQFNTQGDIVNFRGVMSLADWNAGAALDSLNVACKDLHKGPDGISKTWNDVLIEASVVVKK